MAETELAVVIGFALCLGTIIFLASRLAIANRTTQAFASKCLEHALAINADEREFMRMKIETDREELLLREKRDVERHRTGRRINEDGQAPDISANTGIVMD